MAAPDRGFPRVAADQSAGIVLMPRLSPIHWKKFEKFLLYVGCFFEREKGDHRIYGREDLNRPVVVPRDTQLPVFVIRNNLRVLGISTKDYLDIFERI